MTNPIKAIAGLNGTEYLEMNDEEANAFNVMQAASLSAQPKQEILDAIDLLESKVTQRRLREAVSGTDNGWLSNVNSQISTLRSQL